MGRIPPQCARPAPCQPCAARPHAVHPLLPLPRQVKQWTVRRSSARWSSCTSPRRATPSRSRPPCAQTATGVEVYLGARWLGGPRRVSRLPLTGLACGRMVRPGAWRLNTGGERRGLLFADLHAPVRAMLLPTRLSSPHMMAPQHGAELGPKAPPLPHLSSGQQGEPGSLHPWRIPVLAQEPWLGGPGSGLRTAVRRGAKGPGAGGSGKRLAGRKMGWIDGRSSLQACHRCVLTTRTSGNLANAHSPLPMRAGVVAPHPDACHPAL